MSTERENELNDREDFEEPSLEDFLDEEEDEHTKEMEQYRIKRRQKMFRLIAFSICLFLVINGLSIWFKLYNFDSIGLNRESKELSKEEYIQKYKEAVVMIQRDNSRGTGFAVSANGLIVTNHHVVEGTGPLIISFPSGEKFIGDVIESDQEIDIALVDVDGNDLPYLTLSTKETNLNEKIYVIGNPLLQSQIVNEGTILEKADTYDVVKISAPIFRGHSGSPVISEEGEVVAVVYAKTIPTIFNEDDSAGLAVPIELVHKKINELE
ncbi:S1C family serine protease [Halalkalibacter urbisdiaboli]|uniref:S1C family serine protease n=1 Tax=Halalkalibacter urbisdiaboli TaxID=1960589 RepID=UPI000B4456C7|nr:serine protease [Halalkalibacter urbisdiaboli]